MKADILALYAENERLRSAIQQTLDENGHLADGENCTLIVLKRALKTPTHEVSRLRRFWRRSARLTGWRALLQRGNLDAQ